MDMTLSKRGDYVTRAAIALARAYGEGAPRKIREVVADTEVPATFASQILSDLVRAGLATSKAGRVGGYRLARPPEQISVLEVIEAGEGPLRSERCALGDGPCRWEAVCPLHETWTAATASLRGLLSQTTLAELAARDEAIEAGVYHVPPDSHRSHPGSAQSSDSVQVELAADDVRRALAGYGARAAALVGPGTEASLAAPGGGEDVGRLLLDWRTAGERRTTRLEGTATVEEIDAERSEIRVEATWHQQGDTHALLDEAGLAAEARRNLRGFLRRLAGDLEESS